LLSREKKTGTGEWLCYFEDLTGWKKDEGHNKKSKDGVVATIGQMNENRRWGNEHLTATESRTLQQKSNSLLKK
jgi:hypothetical protein